VAIIPARLQSTRLPEKALQDLGGAPLIVRVLERVRSAEALGGIWVATDSERIADAVRSAGCQAILTRADHASGLDRVAEAAEQLAGGSGGSPEDVIVNIQGDEPFVSPRGLDHMVRLFERPEVRMGTVAAPFSDPAEAGEPSKVKLVIDRESRALYFSRAPIPWGHGPDATLLLHVGVYAYRRSVLRELAALPPAPLEKAERLEQLRALWNGIPIHVAVGDYHSLGIDTPEDLARARTRWEERRTTT
jgi:3-deoxy-manno-octulosonate cytidylyltransferase (CMP-KDO synthetase)